MGRHDLPELARRFDALYTELTNLQRELVAAVRHGHEEPAPELRQRAEAVIAGVQAAHAALAVGRLNRREAEAAALRARVLALPLDADLLTAALRAQPRRHAFPLLADALRLAVEADELEALNDCSFVELLTAPRGMGEGTARGLLVHFDVAPDDTPVNLDPEALSRVIEGLHAAASELPEGVGLRARHTGRKPRPDGSGQARVVLDAWTAGVERGELYATVRQAAGRDGWSDDAAEVAEILCDFTERTLVPAVLPEWESVAALEASDERLGAIRVLRSDWWNRDEQEWRELALLLDWLSDALKAAAKARRLLDGPESAWGSSTPLALSRTCAWRCGQFLSVWEPQHVQPLLDQLSLAAGRGHVARPREGDQP